MQRHDPDGARLPIKLDTTSNGEFTPVPLDAAAKAANKNAMEKVGEAARKLGMKRRDYLITTAGAAATLAAMNEAFAAAGKTGGSYELPKEAAFETAAADSVVAGKEFIFDVQLHHVNPQGEWRNSQPGRENTFRNFAKAQADCREGDPVVCLDQEHLLREVFMDSDTTAAVLSSVPSAPTNPLLIKEAAETRALAAKLKGSPRLLIHGLCHPNFPGHVEGMDEVLKTYGIVGWKTYTQWGPDGKGYWLDDEATGIRMIEKARSQGMRIICVHKGLPLGNILSYDFSTCRDVGVVARRYPDMNFLIYHSGYEPSQTEGPYDEKVLKGVNSLVHTLKENGIKPGSNVYAELGSTWRLIMRDPSQAAHVLGKLMLAVGENNILWGTDSIWYGSPQDQIQAFRAFTISEEFQNKFGYPALTPERKRKIFGLNGAKVYGLNPAELQRKAETDDWGKARAAYLPEKDPSFLTYGPKTRREFMALLRANGGAPA
jgi:predicted TIM-barrel fold metal-dependent hydrolase